MVFAFFYGLWSESIPLFGSSKKNYVLLMSLIQTITCIMIVVIPENQTSQSIQLTSLLLMFNSLSMSWTDTIVDGMVVELQRIDPIHGSSDL
jgi:BT1 family